ncbi:MAG TPA: hypothetical protein VG963_27635 [Polyangiaceae bacterium]|nr:hypothetical protein [Polyangiaceae bacterium]
MKYKLLTISALFAGALTLSTPARADVALGGGALIGTGVDTGKANNNPYRLQLGGYGELEWDSLVLGVRGTRSLKSDPEACADKHCRDVKDLRTIGGDIGFQWMLAILRLGPHLGIGYLKERNGDRVGAYFEPGVVADIALAFFNVGAELRYRAVTHASDANGFLGYLKLGIRL